MSMVLARHVTVVTCLVVALGAFARPFTVEMLPREHYVDGAHLQPEREGYP